MIRLLCFGYFRLERRPFGADSASVIAEANLSTSGSPIVGHRIDGNVCAGDILVTDAPGAGFEDFEIAVLC